MTVKEGNRQMTRKYKVFGDGDPWGITWNESLAFDFPTIIEYDPIYTQGSSKMW